MPSYKTTNPLDAHVNTEWMRVCKCVLPYLDRQTQRNVAISLKFMELMSVMQLYSSNQTAPMDPISLTRSEHWENELLRSVRSNLSPEKAFIVDAIMKIGEARNILLEHHSNETELPPSASASKPLFADEIEDAPPDFPDPTRTQFSSPTNTKQSSADPSAMIDMLAPLLDDNQRQMLKLFTTFMK